MGITIRKYGGGGGGGGDGPPRFNGDGIARLIKGLVPGEILRRTDQGIDANGQQFAPYSRRYQNTLRRGGEDPKVDLHLTGGLMNSIKARGATIGADYVEVIIAPDTGTSPVWTPTKGGKKRYERAMRRFARAGKKGDYSIGPLAARQAQSAYRMKTVAHKRSPPHNVVGYWLHYGTPKMRARPFMGLTPEQTAKMWQMISRIMWRR